jgi:hypothetical protein
LTFPASPFLVLKLARGARVGVDLVMELRVVVDSGTDKPRLDAEILRCFLDVALVATHSRDNLVHVQPRPDEEWLTTAGGAVVEADQRVPIHSKRLTEQTVSERVPRLTGPLRRPVEQGQGFCR